MNNFRSLQKKNKWYKNFAAFSIVLYVLRPFLTGLKQDLIKLFVQGTEHKAQFEIFRTVIMSFSRKS